MAKMFLEVVTSKFKNGSHLRDKERSLVEFNIDHAVTDLFPSAEELKEIEDEILEIITKYAHENNVVLGTKNSNGIVGTNMHHDRKYSTELFIERENGYFRRIIIQKESLYMKTSSITFDWFVGHNQYWTIIDGSFKIHHILRDKYSSDWIEF